MSCHRIALRFALFASWLLLVLSFAPSKPTKTYLNVEHAMRAPFSRLPFKATALTATREATREVGVGRDVSEVRGASPFVLHVPALRHRSPPPSPQEEDASMSSPRMELRRAELKSVFGPTRVLPRTATRRTRDGIQGN